MVMVSINGITSIVTRMDVLRQIAQKGQGTSSEVARSLGAHPRTISSQVSNLSGMGAIRRMTNPIQGKRRRGAIWRITDEGHAMLADPARMKRQRKAPGKIPIESEGKQMLNAFLERERQRVMRAGFTATRAAAHVADFRARVTASFVSERDLYNGISPG